MRLPRWQPSMLLVGTSDEDDAAVVHPHLRTLPVLGAVVRRVIPTLVEATVIPALLVYGFVALGSLTLAMVSALAWTGGVLAWRRLTRRSIPGVLLLAAAGLTVRTVVGISSGNPIVYFMQPIAATMALAVVFLGTLLTDRPIIARLAVDFCPLSPEVAVRPAVVQLFRELTVMWAAVHVANAAATFALLMSVPTATFIATKTVTCVGISSCAVVVTVVRSLGIARRERLAFVPAG